MQKHRSRFLRSGGGLFCHVNTSQAKPSQAQAQANLPHQKNARTNTYQKVASANQLLPLRSGRSARKAMHHEVLLAAVGCPGDIILPTARGETYAVAPDVSFLSPGACA